MTLFQITKSQLFIQLKTWLENHRQLALAISIISPAFVIAFPFICILISSHNQPDLARAVCFVGLISLQVAILSICINHLKSAPNMQFLLLVMHSKARIARGLIPLLFLMCSPIWVPLCLLLWANVDDGSAHLSWLSTIYVWATTLAICLLSCWSLKSAILVALLASVSFSSLIIEAHRLSLGIVICVGLLFFTQNQFVLSLCKKVIQLIARGKLGLILQQYLKQWISWWLLCALLMPITSWIVFEYLSDFQKFEWLIVHMLIIYNLGFKRFNLLVEDIEPQYAGMQSIFGIKKPSSNQLVSLLSIGIVLALSVFFTLALKVDTGVQPTSLIHFCLMTLFSFVLTCMLLNKKWPHAIVAGHFIPVLLGVVYYLFWPSCCG